MSEIELLALHGLAVKKAGGAAAVAAVVDREEAEVATALEAAVAAGRAAGAKGTFMVAPAGRAWLLEQYPVAYAAFRKDPAAADAYTRFERINRRLLALFTDWQMVDAAGGRVSNDHTDPEYDRRIVDRLGDQHERATRVLDDLAALESRLGAHGRRLEAAYDRVLAGEHDYVSGVRIDSYHTVWFELHEDLLRMLGREREDAP